MGQKPGQTGNPNGRPRKELSLTHILQEYGETLTINVDGKKLQYRQALMLKMWNMALKGDRDMAKYIMDRIDGKVKEKIEHSGAIGEFLTNMSEIIYNGNEEKDNK